MKWVLCFKTMCVHLINKNALIENVFKYYYFNPRNF